MTVDRILSLAMLLFFGLIISLIIYGEWKRSRFYKEMKTNEKAVAENPVLKEVTCIETVGTITRKFKDIDLDYTYEIEVEFNDEEIVFDYMITREDADTILHDNIGDQVFIRMVQTPLQLENGKPIPNSEDYILWQVKSL